MQFIVGKLYLNILFKKIYFCGHRVFFSPGPEVVICSYMLFGPHIHFLSIILKIDA